jgi:hypothetical protein
MKTFSLYFLVNFNIKHYFKIELPVAKLFIYTDTLFVCTNTHLSLSFVICLLCVEGMWAIKMVWWWLLIVQQKLECLKDMCLH